MTRKKHILLLHGWGLGTGVWQEFKQKYITDAHISAPDIFANQTVDRPKRLFEIAVEKINSHITDNTAIISWSLGGLLAIELATRNPGRNTPLILLNSTPCFAARHNWPNGLDGDAIKNLRLICQDDPKAALSHFCSLAAIGERSPRKVMRHLKTVASNQKNDGVLLASWLRTLTELDCRKQYKKLPGPIHVLLGEGDRLVSPKIEKQLIALNNKSRIKIMPLCGHVPFISKPGATAEFIQRALA